MRSLLHLIIYAFVVCATATGCRPKADKAERSDVDTTLALAANILFAQPQRADSIYARLQGRLTDSTLYYHVEIYRATARYLNGDTARAFADYDKVERYCRSHSQAAYLDGLVQNHRGVDAILAGDEHRGIAYYEQAYRLLNRPPKRAELIPVTVNLADNYWKMGHLPQSAEYYRYALYLCDSLGSATPRAPIYSGLGQVYMELSNFNEAHHFFALAKSVIDDEDVQSQFYYYFALGNCFYYENRYDEALKSFFRADTLGQRWGNESALVYCYANLGEIYLMQNRLAEAEKYIARSERMIADGVQIIPSNLFYLQSLRADLQIARGDTHAARPFLQQNADSILAAFPRYLLLHYRRLQHYAEGEENWKAAYRYRSRAERYADSLRSRQTLNSVAELAGRYSRDTTVLRQRLSLADLSAHAARQRGYIALAVAACIIIGLASVLLAAMYRRRTRFRIRRQMEQMTRLRMDIVRNRVSPHYIFNVLGTILPKLQRHPDVEEAVDLLIDVLRGNLLSSGKVAVPLADELTLVRRYVDLHHYSRGAWPKVEWHIAPELFESAIPIPSMAIQIPVENALKHAFPTLTDRSVITITAHTEAQMLHLAVEDNGQGYNPGKVVRTERDTGTGLRLLTRTIDILNRYNHRAATFAITNLAAPRHGTRVSLSLPVDYDFRTSDEA